MRAVIVLALTALLFATAVHAGGDVLVLDESNFDNTIKEQKQTLVEFYAPWCGHCKALAPEYDAAAKELDGKDAGALAKVDCTVEKDLCNRFDVRGFPTVKLFTPDGADPTEYDQARKADAIVKFMVKQVQPAVSDLADLAAVNAFAPSDNVKIVAFVDGNSDSTAFEGAAKLLRNEYSFGRSTDAAAAAEFKVNVPGFVVFRNFDEGNVVYSGDFNNKDEIVAYIKGQSFPLVGEIGPENYAKYLERGFPFFWIFVDNDDTAQTNLVQNVVAPAARAFRNKVSFVKLDGVKWGEHAKSFGLSGNTPGIVIEDRNRHKNYIFPEDKTASAAVADIESFLSGWDDGSLAPNIKSEPIPESNDGPVKVIVGKTFDEIVMDDSKDVLVEFYAPWCGHCKSLAPKYDELGTMFKDTPSVVIAKVDATANDTPADVQGFPTLIFYPAGDKANPVDYNGARTAQAMAEFIRKNARSLAGAAATEGGKDEL